MRIYKLGEEVLREKCEPVKPEEINDEFRAFLDKMFETMISANGVGLAAPQVGIKKRFFIVIAGDDIRRVFINPQIIKTSVECSEFEEGCLSLPGYSEMIVRPEKISVSAINEKGKRFTINDAEGLLARVVQHENDHLDGILYIDRGTEEFKQEMIEEFKKKAERKAQRASEKEAKRKKSEQNVASCKTKGN